MSYKIARTLEGTVIREFWAGGERAYRRHHDGTWSYTIDHKNFWLVIDERDVPTDIRALIVPAASVV